MNLQIYVSESHDPYFNLALEDLLFDTVPDETVVLYVWQNADTVVIGKSQNAWSEVRVSELEADGGRLARRTSGGGAVYHDLGNLCYTFIASSGLYDLERQLKVILNAVKSAGIDAMFTGRNDIIASDGRKFSGNAFRFVKDKGLMHGTLLVNTDPSRLQRYLQVSPAKIKAKGVASVRARVVNLSELSPAATTEFLSTALMDAFIKEYSSGNDTAPVPVHVSKTEQTVTAENGEFSLVTPDAALPCIDSFPNRYIRFASWEWRMGETLPFNLEKEHKFAWGLISARLLVESGIIQNAGIYTDAMDADLGAVLSAGLAGTKLDTASITAAVQASCALIKSSGKAVADMSEVSRDLIQFFKEI